MKAFEIIGYTYDADIHCPCCARERFDDLDSELEEDSEGNPIHPVFAGDESEGPEVCGTCGDEIEA